MTNQLQKKMLVSASQMCGFLFFIFSESVSLDFGLLEKISNLKMPPGALGNFDGHVSLFSDILWTFMNNLIKD